MADKEFLLHLADALIRFAWSLEAGHVSSGGIPSAVAHLRKIADKMPSLCPCGEIKRGSADHSQDCKWYDIGFTT